ncbi:MAG TPA: GNAT family N-acetyltransferase [Caldilineaceae bacterium]|nr:GNAT family N-acetyltransferase [Caldilineaceae bacterium]
MFHIHRAKVSDAPEILALQYIAYQSEAHLYGDPHLPPLQETLAQLEATFDTHIVLKAVIDGVIVGSVRACCADGICRIGRLMVHPQWQGRGIGTALMQAIEAAFSYASRYELFTGARSEGNIRLYRRLGYTIAGTEAINDRVTIVHMSKPAPDRQASELHGQGRMSL